MNWKVSVATLVVTALLGASAALAQNEPAQPGYTASTQTKPMVHHRLKSSHLRPGTTTGLAPRGMTPGEGRARPGGQSGVRKQPSS
jgi:hypothetical protein